VTFQTIKVEKLEPHTFNSWTDGAKVLLATRACMDVPYRPLGLPSVWARAERLLEEIGNWPAITTFYVYADLGEFLPMVYAYPDRDLRLLID
jgi:hypothetical protein